MEFLLVSALNGLSYGLLLFLLSAGLTVVFSLMGVLNFAHASFYMLGAYLGFQIALWTNFWIALIAAPLLVGAFGMAVERHLLRAVHRQGQTAELLLTFGLAYLVAEAVQLLWGRSALPFRPPALLDGPLFTLYGTAFPAWRAFMMAISVAILIALRLVLKRTRIGLIVQAAHTHPHIVEALGHDVPRIFMQVFGAGAALAALAGVIGGSAFVTEPGMAAAIGPVIFVIVVIGGLGSLAGAFVASIALGLLQTFAVGLDVHIGNVGLAQAAPMLPFLLMALVLIARPRGLLGNRAD
jgi:branched-chain amino acid transport system permease protein